MRVHLAIYHSYEASRDALKALKAAMLRDFSQAIAQSPLTTYQYQKQFESILLHPSYACFILFCYLKVRKTILTVLVTFSF